MKYILLLTFLSFFLPGTTSAQSDSASLEDLPVNLLSADLKTKKAVIDLDNTEEKEFALKKIHTFKYLESLTIEGYSDDNTLQKLLYRISALRNLSEITLSENDLEKVPDNISALKYLQSLKIEGNINLDYQDLFNQIKNLQIIQLKLSDNDLKKIPTSISEIKSLRTVEITGSNRLDYEDLVSQLTRLPYLRTLAIPVNYITELPKNIDQLKSLQILDVSNNNLTELPAEVSGLKSINRLSIQGNLLLNPTAELSKLKGTNIQFLSLDKEIAAEELENIKRIFPDVEIDFPVQNLTKGPSDPNDLYGEDPALPSPKQRTGELKTKKESRILSGAYLYYPTLFRGLIYNFDTLTFEERYANTGYENVYRILDANPWRSAGVYFRKWLIGAETPGKRHETWFRLGNDAMVNNNYPELRAFSGMYWVYQGPLTKKQFTKKFIRGKGLAKRFKRKRSFVWNDIRIRFEKNNSLFTFQMKNDTGFLEFNAYPVFPDYPLDKIRQTYYKRYSLYQKTLFNRSQRFARSYRRNRNNYESSYRRLKSLAWKELQTRMSDEEKLMSQDEWLEYFDATVANEETSLNNSSLQLIYILRSLSLKGYREETVAAPPLNRTITNYNIKTIEANFADSKNNSNLPVTNVWILDNKNKRYYQVNGTLGITPISLNLKQFSSYTIMVELRNGDWGFVSPEEIDSKMFEPNETQVFKTKVLDKNLDTIGTLFKSVIP